MTIRPLVRDVPRPTVRVLALIAALTWAAFASARADAYVYWSASSNNAIERANLDGKGVTQLVQGASQPEGVAVSGSYIYWANNGDGDIGRASVDGTNVDQQFITGGDQVRDVAVQGNYIYWTNSGTGLHSIGRANLDGSAVNQSFVTMPVDPGNPNTGDANPWWIAADSNYLYVSEPYYVLCNPYCHGGSIGRISLDGSSRDYRFISTEDFPQGIAVNSSDIYWVEAASHGGSTYIERANLDGSSVNAAFQPATTNQNGGGVALDSNYIYWAQSDPSPFGVTGSIGRATLDDLNANKFFIYDQNVAYGQPWGIAVDGLNPPPSSPPGGGSQGGSQSAGQGGPQGGASKPTCTVPMLRGLTLSRARQALTQAACGLGKVRRRRAHGTKRGRVVKSNPAAGRRLGAGARVALIIAK